MEKVGIGGERALAAFVLGHLDLMRLGPGDQRGTAGEIPFAPWGDDLDVGVQRIGRQFEADLVVALAGRTVRDGIGAGFVRDLHQTLGDQRACDAGAEEVVPFVAGVHAHHRKDEIAHEFFAQIFDENVIVGNAHGLRLVARRAEFFALAQIGSEGHHFAATFHLEPFGDHAGVETARIGENDAADRRGGGIGHGMSLKADVSARALTGSGHGGNRLGHAKPTAVGCPCCPCD